MTETPADVGDDVAIIRAAGLPPQPWRNGGGTTREIHAAPSEPHAVPAWRLSLATIATDGPFSTFPGLDRSLLLLSPTVLELTVDGTVHRLTQDCVLDFAGEASVVAVTGGTASQALNLMTCRACLAASWCLREYKGPQRLSRADAPAMVLLEGSASVEGQELQRHDTVVLGRTPTTAVFRGARVAVVDTATGAEATQPPTGAEPRSRTATQRSREEGSG